MPITASSLPHQGHSYKIKGQQIDNGRLLFVFLELDIHFLLVRFFNKMLSPVFIC